jgi:hypothetical protein
VPPGASDGASRTERWAQVLAAAGFVVAAGVALSAYFVDLPLAVGLAGVVAALVAAVIFGVGLFRGSRRRGRGRLRSVGHAVWEAVKFLFSLP